MVTPDWLPAWDGELYAANTGHHRIHDEWFRASLPLRPTHRLLDLGCGAGDFTRTIADQLAHGAVVGLDPQPSLLAVARRRAGPNQTFIEGAVQALPTLLPTPAEFDVVMSRSAMHWVPMHDHPRLLSDVHRLLRPGGWFRLELGGVGNIPVILPVLNDVSRDFGGPTSPWTFPDPAVYLELLEAAGFSTEGGHVQAVAQRRQFDRKALLGWLHSQCLQAFELGLPADRHRAFRAAAEVRLADMRRHDGTYDQTFVRLDVLVRRPPT
jgi:trans-aconitate methyltransferase